jgi:hypothetical protein
MRIPAATTQPNITIVAPPSTGAGIWRSIRRTAETAQQNQNHADVAADVAAGDAGHLDHAVVLRKGGIGERAQHRRHHAADAIGKDAAFQPERKASSSIDC